MVDYGSTHNKQSNRHSKSVTQADSTMTAMLFARKSWAHNQEQDTQQQGGITGQINKSKQQSNS